jgi:heme exporter protein D
VVPCVVAVFVPARGLPDSQGFDGAYWSALAAVLTSLGVAVFVSVRTRRLEDPELNASVTSAYAGMVFAAAVGSVSCLVAIAHRPTPGTGLHAALVVGTAVGGSVLALAVVAIAAVPRKLQGVEATSRHTTGSRYALAVIALGLAIGTLTEPLAGEAVALALVLVPLSFVVARQHVPIAWLRQRGTVSMERLIDVRAALVPPLAALIVSEAVTAIVEPASEPAYGAESGIGVALFVSFAVGLPMRQGVAASMLRAGIWTGGGLTSLLAIVFTLRGVVGDPSATDHGIALAAIGIAALTLFGLGYRVLMGDAD